MRTIRRDIVGGFIFSADDELLLGQSRTGGVYDNAWSVPGGGVDEGETHEEALFREMKEETGLDISQAAIEKVTGSQTGTSEKILRDTGERVLVSMVFHDYVIRLPLKLDQIKVDAKDDWTNAKWYSRSQLEKLSLAPPTAQRLRQLGYLK